MTWEEAIDLLKAYNKAMEEEDEETAMRIANVFPDDVNIEEMLEYYKNKEEEMYCDFIASKNPWYGNEIPDEI